MDPIFRPFRALGYITDATPFAVNKKGKVHWVAVSVGKTWQLYDCRKITLTMVGPQLPAKITALACKGNYTIAAAGGRISVSHRAHLVHWWPGHKGDVLQLLFMGSLIVSLGTDAYLRIWDLDNRSSDPVKEVHLGDGFEATCMAHPATYVNKVLVGASDGSMQLRNINTGALLYTFKMGSRICCIEGSPALDVVGVGLANGTAVLHNVKFDEEVVRFENAASAGTAQAARKDRPGRKQAASGPCTCLAFRSGGGTPIMAAGGTSGSITIWNLEAQKLQTVLERAHSGAVCEAFFFPGEPVLMTSAADNSLKHFIFDNEDGSGRLLRFRSGHGAPPQKLLFYGTSGNVLLSASADQALRVFSVIQDHQSRELSQVHTKRRASQLGVDEQELKLPEIVGLAASSAREKDWANILTAHAGEPTAFTWLSSRYRLADHELALPNKQLLDGTVPAAATAVAASLCGNFGFVGTASGRIDKYNMQSGIHRGRLSAESGADAHGAAVVGITCDACNRMAISVSQRGDVRRWGLKSRKLEAELLLGCEALRLSMHPHSKLCAVCCSDHAVRVVDADQMAVVRQFKGHSDRLTDACISSDSKLVISAGLDSTLRVWDIPSAHCLQALHVGSPVTSLAMSPTMELLATAHVNRRGIYLWANQLLFGSGAGVQPSSEIVHVRPATVSSGRSFVGNTRENGTLAGTRDWDSDDDSFEGSSGDDGDASVGTHVDAGDEVAEAEGQTAAYEERDACGVPTPLRAGLLTLSGDPMSKWDSLVHLQAIKARNKPEEAPKKPEAAPFFLPTMEAQEMRQLGEEASALLAAAAAPQAGDEVAQSQLKRSSDPAQQRVSQSPLLRLLVGDLRGGGDFSDALRWLQGSSPVLIERELACVDAVAPCEAVDVEAVEAMLSYVSCHLKTQKNFDHVIGVLSLVLHLHGAAIPQHEQLHKKCKEIKDQLDAAWQKVDASVQTLRCLVLLFGRMQV